MAKVHIKNNGQTVDAVIVRSLLVNFQMNEVPIETICGGKARCGKCAVKIKEGKKNLNPISETEAKRLKAMNYDEDTRLACQTYPGRDITVEIVNYPKS